MNLFSEIVTALESFVPKDPMVTEATLESAIELHLLKNNFVITRQVSQENDRYDLLCRRDNEVVCIEVKLRADTTDIRQFDKYLKKFKDGFIIICWQASFSIKEITEHVIQQSPFPLALIELAKRYNLT